MRTKLQALFRNRFSYSLVVAFVFLCQNMNAQVPTISGFSPTNAATGETVTITGTNFASITAVRFGGTNAASYTVVSTTKITAVVAAGTTGSVTVTRASGTATSAGFTYATIPNVTRIMTDFGGYWNSTTTANNGTWPDNSHNLLGFTYGGVTYSTGVNDAAMSSNGVSFSSGSFKALPAILSGVTGSGSLYISAGIKKDGNATSALYTHPNIKDMTIESVLSDGINGLDLGTGYTNLPTGATASFGINSILPSKISDNEPDIVITQTAQPVDASIDTYSFLNASGVVVGNSVTQNVFKISKLGTWKMDFYTVPVGVAYSLAKVNGIAGGGFTNTDREIRLVAYKLSDFGINATNYSQIRSLKITPSGTSDVSFVAYNAKSINVPPTIAQDASSTVICTSGSSTAQLAVHSISAGDYALTYTWYVSTDGGTTYSTIANGATYSGATTNNMTINGATSGYKYYAIVTEAGTGYSATSDVFTITSVTGTALAGTLNPTAFSNCLNAASGVTSLSVAPTGGTGSYSYQWSSSTSAGGTYTNISGATANTYSPPLDVVGTLYYKVAIKSGCYSNAPAATAVTITGQVINTVTNGFSCGTGTVTLGATASGGTINWYAAVSGGTSLGTGGTFVTPSIAASKTYYVSTSSTGPTCESPRMPVQATITGSISLDSSNFNIINASSVCTGSPSTITIASSVLPDGTYTVTYNISGANSSTGNTATMVFASGTGTFTSVPLTSGGTNVINFTITGVSISGCTLVPGSGNLASVSINSSSPSVSNFSISATPTCSNQGSIVTVSSTTLATGTYLVSYAISGINTVATTTAQMVFTAGAPGTGSFELPIFLGTGTDTVSISSVALLSAPTCSSAVSSSANFSLNFQPVINVASGLITTCASVPTISIGSAIVSASNYTALTWTTSGSGTFAGNTTATALTTATYAPSTSDITAGFVNLTLTATANAGCTDAIQVIALTLVPVSVAGTTSADATICTNTTTTVSLLTGTVGTIQWQQSANNSTWANVTGGTGATTAVYTTPALTALTYYRALVTNGICSTATSSVIVISISPVSVGGTVTGGATVCSGTNSTTLTLTGNTGTVTKWQSSTVSNFSSAVTDIANTTTTLTATNLTVMTYYRAVVASGTCTAANSASATIAMTPASVGGSVSGSTAVCTGTNSTILTLSGYTDTITKWQSSTVSDFSSAVTDIANTTTSLTAVNLTTTTYYRAVVANGSCTGVSSAVATITVNPVSVGGTVSSDQNSTCTNTLISDLTLTGNTGTVVKWQKALDAAFTTPTDIAVTSTTLSSAAIGTLTNTTYFRAVVQSGACSTATSSYATITVTATTWDGSTWSNGTPTSASAVIMTGNFSSTTNYSSADLYACTLTVTNNAVVLVNAGSNFVVTGAVTVATGSSLTLESNANLVQVVATNNNSGNIIVKRDTSPLNRLDYVIWSAPVVGQNLLSFSPLTALTPTIRFYTYNPATDIYNVVPSPATTNFATGTGYLIRVPNTFPDVSLNTPTIFHGQFQGTINNGNYNITIPSGKYNAVGNPYPSTIDADVFMTANGITEPLYYWRKTNDTQKSSYATYLFGTAVANIGGLSNLEPTKYIQVGQGFIIKSNSSTLSFTNAMRVKNNSDLFLKTNTIERNRIWLNLNGENFSANQMAVSYMTGGTEGFDPGMDGRYINDSPIALNSFIDNEEFAIQARSLPFLTTDVVPLAFKTTIPGNYTIAIDHVDGLFLANQDIFLKDNLTNAVHDIKLSAYSFASESGIFNSRFELVYQNPALGTQNPGLTANSLIVFKDGGTININSGRTIMKNVKIFDVRGRMLFEQKNVNATTTSITNLNVAQQVLIVQITSDEDKEISKKVVF